MDEVGFQESTDEKDRISSMVWGWADQGATFPQFFLKVNTIQMGFLNIGQ